MGCQQPLRWFWPELLELQALGRLNADHDWLSGGDVGAVLHVLLALLLLRGLLAMMLVRQNRDMDREMRLSHGHITAPTGMHLCLCACPARSQSLTRGHLRNTDNSTLNI